MKYEDFFEDENFLKTNIQEDRNNTKIEYLVFLLKTEKLHYLENFQGGPKVFSFVWNFRIHFQLYPPKRFRRRILVVNVHFVGDTYFMETTSSPTANINLFGSP